MGKVFVTKSLEVFDGNGSITLNPDSDGLGMVVVKVDDHFGLGSFSINTEVAESLASALLGMVEHLRELEEG